MILRAANYMKGIYVGELGITLFDFLSWQRIKLTGKTKDYIANKILI